MRARQVAAVLALFLAPLSAQTIFYSPPPLAHHAGMTSTGYPFGYSSTTSITYQQVHGDLPLGPRPLRSLAIRPYSSTASHGTFTVTGTMTLGVGGPTPDNATSTFATNLGPQPQVVIQGVRINMPAYTKPSAPPADFVYRFPFSKVFLYDGKGVLCWEYRMTAHTQPGSISFDLYYHRTTPYLQSGGQGCTASGQSGPLTLGGTFTAGSLALNCTNAPSGPGLLLLVGNKNQTYGGLPLPFDLTGLGAPCALRTSVELTLPPQGSGWNFSVPATAPGGAAIFLQAIALDPPANPLGLVLSNGLVALWPYTNRPCVRIWQTNSATATTGSLQLPYGEVIKLSM